MLIENSIIIPTYKMDVNIFKRNIYSVINILSNNTEVIIVSNGQTDEFNKWVSDNLEDISNVKVLYYDQPLGYVKAVNKGVEHSIGNFIIFLNDDVEFINYGKDYQIFFLKEPFLYNKNCGISGPKSKIFIYKNNKFDYIFEFVVFFYAMFKRELFYKIGLLNEDFNVGGYDDFEYSERCKFFGYDICFTPYGKNLLQLNEYLLPLKHFKSYTLKKIDNLDEVLNQNFSILRKIINDRFSDFYMKSLRYLFNDSLYTYVVKLLSMINNKKKFKILELGSRLGISLNYIYNYVDKYCGLDKDRIKVDFSNKFFRKDNINFIVYNFLNDFLFLRKQINNYDIILSIDVMTQDEYFKIKNFLEDKFYILKFKGCNFILHNINNELKENKIML